MNLKKHLLAKFSTTTIVCVAIFCMLTTVYLPRTSSAQELHFNDVTKRAGLDYTGTGSKIRAQLAPSFVDNQGLYASDVNDDGWTDLLLLGGKEPKLFRNNQGTFKEQTSFPKFRKKINSALFLDYNMDGEKDLILIPQVGKIQLLENQNGNFKKDHRLSEPILTAGIGVTAGDFNQDGCPDLFVLQYGPGSTQGAKKQKLYRRGAQYRSFQRDNGRRNYLLKGDCQTFRLHKNKTFERSHWSLATSFKDFTGNGLQDIHVANDFYRDSLYKNLGNGKFQHTYLPLSTSRNGMSSQITDFNRDGHPDLFVSNIFVDSTSRIMDHQFFKARITADPYGHNALVNQSGEHFRDRADLYNLQKGGWGWAVSWNDFNLDFTMELIQGLQNHLAVPQTLEQFDTSKPQIKRFTSKYFGAKFIPDDVVHQFPYYNDFEYWLGYPNVWIRKKFSTKHFSHFSGREIGFSRLNARGVISLDFDRDGDLDLAISQFSGDYKLFENKIRSRRKINWVKIQIAHPELGGKLTLQLNNRKQYIHLSARSDFASQEPGVYIIGLGTEKILDRLTLNRSSIEDPLTLTDIPSRSLLIVEKGQISVQTNRKGIK